MEAHSEKGGSCGLGSSALTEDAVLRRGAYSSIPDEAKGADLFNIWVTLLV